MCLPLYMVAEKWQDVERNIQKLLAPKIAKIKAVFSGDERYMILSSYYRQNHYHPIYAMRSSFGLLIQVPFFIAAYSYISNEGSFLQAPDYTPVIAVANDGKTPFAKGAAYHINLGIRHD